MPVLNLKVPLLYPVSFKPQNTRYQSVRKPKNRIPSKPCSASNSLPWRSEGSSLWHDSSGSVGRPGNGRPWFHERGLELWVLGLREVRLEPRTRDNKPSAILMAGVEVRISRVLGIYVGVED